MRYRDTASFGKRQEYSVIAELLRRGFDVYATLVDDQGIDCIIRLSKKRYLDVQIKARSRDAKHWNFFPAMSFKPRKNYWFIFYTEKNDIFWILPSKDVFKMAIMNKAGKNKGKRSLSLPRNLARQKAQKFKKYMNDAGFKQLFKG